MDEAIKIRLEKWHYFRRLIALRAKGQFTYHLQNRGYTGSLDFNHDTQKLKLRVRYISLRRLCFSQRNSDTIFGTPLAPHTGANGGF